MSPTLLTLVPFALIAWVGSTPWNMASAADEAKAGKALAPLLARFDDPKSDRSRWWHDLAVFRCDHPGTPSAQRAAALLAQLPSPLDQLALAKPPAVLPKEVVAVLPGHARSVAALAFAADGVTLASSGWDATIRLWKFDGPTAKEWAKLPGSASEVAFAPDGKTLVSGRTDAQVAVWDVTGKEPKERHSLAGHTHRPFATAFTPNGKMLVTGCFGPSLRFWDLRGADPDGWALQSTDEKAGGFSVASLAISGDGKLLATASHTGDAALRLWEIQGALLDERTVPKVKARLLAFAPVGSKLAIHVDGGSVHLWDITKEKTIQGPKLPGHPLPKQQKTVNAMAFAPDGKTLATAGKDEKLIVWDTTTGKQLHAWTLPSEAKALVFAPDGRHLVVGDADGAIYVLRLGV